MKSKMSNNEQNIQQWINIWKSAKHRNNESGEFEGTFLYSILGASK